MFTATIHHRKNQRRASRRGVAAVEMALVLPLFLLVVLGTLTLAQLIYFRKSLVIAAAEGTRLASRRSSTDADVQTYVQQILTARRITGGTVTISPSNIQSLTPGTTITVTTAAPFSGIGQSYVVLSIPTNITVQTAILRE